MWKDFSSQIIKNKKTQRPKTYFQLIDRVGSDGKYQFRLFMIFFLIWFYTGMILLNTNFLFYNKDFQCQQNGLLTGSCQNLICELGSDQRSKFINKDDSFFKSIATQLGEFHCQDQIYISIAQCSVYIGSVIGFILFSYWSDILGRKKGLLISLAVCVIGNILVSLGIQIFSASFGLLLSGAGANSAINISLCFFNQITSNYKRQKYSILVQLSFTLGAIVVTCFYYFINHWQIIQIFLITIPSLISLFLVLFYVEQTPQFLLKKSNQQCIEKINKIGNINYKIMNMIEQEDIICVKQAQMASKQLNELKLSHIDLFKLSSLKQITIFSSFLCFSIYSMYYGSMQIINQFGFDLYSSSFIIQLAQIVVYLPIYVYIKQIRRKVAGLVSFFIPVAISTVLIFVEIPQNCGQMCTQSVVYLIFVFLFRAVVAFYFCIFYLYINQLYPIRVTGIGVGTISAFGSLASILSPFMFDLLSNNVLMMIFCLLSLVGATLINLMPQTVKIKIKTQVQQIQIIKKEQKSLISQRSALSRYSLIKSISKQQV